MPSKETEYAPVKPALVTENEEIFRNAFAVITGTDPSTQGPRPNLVDYLNQLGHVALAAFGSGHAKIPQSVRLYRGEGRVAPEGPIWRDPEMNKLSGQWFTTDIRIAKQFADEAKSRRLGPGRVIYVDVPKSLYEATRLDNLPHLQKFRYSFTEPGDVILPQSWVERAVPMVGP